jgi:MinD superfamily P-loop ATPase
MAREKWIPVIAEDVCSSCGICVEACARRALGIADRVAVLVRPDDCTSAEDCVVACPVTAIEMHWVPWRGDTLRGGWRETPTAE